MHGALGVGGDVGFMRDHQDGDAALAVHAGQQFHDLVAALRIEIAGRLVGEQHFRIGHDGARNGDALLLPAGKFGRGVMRPVFQPDRPQRFARQRMAHRSRFAAIQQRQFDVLLRGGARQQVESLEHEAEMIAPQQRALVARQAFHVRTVEQVRARGRRVETAENVHRGGFAGTAGAHDGDELALANGQIDPAQSLERGLSVTVGLGDGGEPDQRVAHCAEFCVPVMTRSPACRSPLTTCVVRPSDRPTTISTWTGSWSRSSQTVRVRL